MVVLWNSYLRIHGKKTKLSKFRWKNDDIFLISNYIKYLEASIRDLESILSSIEQKIILGGGLDPTKLVKQVYH